MSPQARAHMRRWMVRNVERFVDDCGEVNCTAMVEAWDGEIGSGVETLAEQHPAWDIAAEVAALETKRVAS